jgi:hypothetical protein
MVVIQKQVNNLASVCLGEVFSVDKLLTLNLLLGLRNFPFLYINLNCFDALCKYLFELVSLGPKLTLLKV